jgi:hypothetical protein
LLYCDVPLGCIRGLLWVGYGQFLYILDLA